MNESPSFGNTENNYRKLPGKVPETLPGITGTLSVSNLIRETKRYLPILEAAESDPETWARLTKGTGVATANGYRNIVSKLEGLCSGFLNDGVAHYLAAPQPEVEPVEQSAAFSTKVVFDGTDYGVEFSVGVQSFTLNYVVPEKERAEWMERNLKLAINSAIKKAATPQQPNRDVVEALADDYRFALQRIVAMEPEEDFAPDPGDLLNQVFRVARRALSAPRPEANNNPENQTA